MDPSTPEPIGGNPAKPNDGKKDGADEQQIREAVLAALASVGSHAKNPDHTEQNKERDGNKTRNGLEWWALAINTASTVVVAVFTVVLAFYAYKMYDVTELVRQDSIETGKQTEIAIKAATDIADATKATAESNHQTAESTKQTADANGKTAAALELSNHWLAALSGSFQQTVSLVKQADDISQKLLETAKAAAADNRNTAQTQMRAFVSVDQTRLDINPVTRTVVATIRIHNSGLTPAQNVTTFHALQCLRVSEEAAFFDHLDRPPVLPPQPPPQFSLHVEPQPQLSTLSIGPGNSIQRQMTLTMDADTFAGWQNDSIRGWVFGIIVYKDEFGAKHFTQFRFYRGYDLTNNQSALLLSDNGNDSN